MSLAAFLAVLAVLPGPAHPVPYRDHVTRRTVPRGMLSAPSAIRGAAVPAVPAVPRPDTPTDSDRDIESDDEPGTGPTLVARMLGAAAFGGPGCGSTLAVVGVGDTVRLVDLAVPARPLELARSPARLGKSATSTASVGALGAVSAACPARTLQQSQSGDGGVVALAGLGPRLLVLRWQGSVLVPSTVAPWGELSPSVSASRISDGFTCGSQTELFLIAANPTVAATLSGAPEAADANATSKIVLVGLVATSSSARESGDTPGIAATVRVLGVLDLDLGSSVFDARPARCSFGTGSVQIDVLATLSTGVLAATISVSGGGAYPLAWTFEATGAPLGTTTANDGLAVDPRLPRAFVAADGAGLRTFGFDAAAAAGAAAASGLRNLTLMSQQAVPGWSGGVALYRSPGLSLALVAADPGLFAFDVSGGAAQPQQRWNCSLGGVGAGWNVAVSQALEIALVSYNQGGLQIVQLGQDGGAAVVGHVGNGTQLACGGRAAVPAATTTTDRGVGAAATVCLVGGALALIATCVYTVRRWKVGRHPAAYRILGTTSSNAVFE